MVSLGVKELKRKPKSAQQQLQQCQLQRRDISTNLVAWGIHWFQLNRFFPLQRLPPSLKLTAIKAAGRPEMKTQLLPCNASSVLHPNPKRFRIIHVAIIAFHTGQ